MHSHKERKRRNDLKKASGCLREIIPSLAFKDKASKLSILTSAKDYCAARGWRVSWRDWRRYSRRSW